MVNSEYKSRQICNEIESWNNVKKLDTNKDGKIKLDELKKLDVAKNGTYEDGVISDLEFNEKGITNIVVQDQITSKIPNLKNKIDPIDNRVIFTTKQINEKILDLNCKKESIGCYENDYTIKPLNINIKEITNPNFKNILKNPNLPETNKPCSQPLKSAEKISEPMHRISDNIHNKYLKVKSLLSPEKFQSFENVLNKKERDPQKVNVALDKLLAKIDPFDISDGYKVISEVKNKIVGVADQRRNLKEIASSPIKGSATYLTRKLAGIINVLNSSNNNGINDQNFTDSNQVRTIASISAFTGFGNCGELAACIN